MKNNVIYSIAVASTAIVLIFICATALHPEYVGRRALEIVGVIFFVNIPILVTFDVLAMAKLAPYLVDKYPIIRNVKFKILFAVSVSVVGFIVINFIMQFIRS